MSAPVIPEGLEPLGVWDTHERLGPWRAGGDEDREERWVQMTQAADWAAPLIGRAEDTYRVEFSLFDMPFMRVFRHSRREDGRLHWNPGARRPYTEEPVIVPLAELPPAHLLKG